MVREKLQILRTSFVRTMRSMPIHRREERALELGSMETLSLPIPYEGVDA